MFKDELIIIRHARSRHKSMAQATAVICKMDEKTKVGLVSLQILVANSRRRPGLRASSFTFLREEGQCSMLQKLQRSTPVC